MAVTLIGGTEQVSAPANLQVFVGQVTTSAGGDATLAHGLQREPKIAFALSDTGSDVSAAGLVVTVDGVNVTLASGGNAVPYTVIAFG